MTQYISNHSSIQKLLAEIKNEVHEFFNSHIASLEKEFAYKDNSAVRKYLNDGVFAVQYTRFLNRLSNKIKMNLKKYGKEYLEKHYSDQEDYLDVVIRFTKDVDKFYVKQEQLSIKNGTFQVDKSDAIFNGVSAGVLTAALTYGLAVFVFRTPFLISTVTSGAFGSIVGGQVFKSKLENSQNKAIQEEKEAIIKQVKTGLEECRKKTVKNVDDLLDDFNAMFAEFLKGMKTHAISTT